LSVFQRSIKYINQEPIDFIIIMSI
jgi:hypothetical protein